MRWGMGEIILGYDPMLVLPRRAEVDGMGFAHALKKFNDRVKRGQGLLVLPVREYGGDYVAIDGQKRLVIAHLEGLKIDLYVANSKRDGIVPEQLDGRDESMRKSINWAIWNGFWRTPRDMLNARFEGVMDVGDLVEKNREKINSAYISVFGRGIQGLPVSAR